MAFPGTGVASFISKVDLVDTIYANHVNLLQTELAATQTSLGNTLLNANYDASAWVLPTTAYSTLADRITNIERGLLNGVSLAPYLWRSGGTMTGALNMGTFKITNLATPTSASDAATKQYVDTAAASIPGIQGVQGIQGIQGLFGTQGTQGTQGVSVQGIQGTQGTRGLQGIQGFGYSQLQGTQGTQGTQGIQGFGYSQLQGTQGTQGTQGIQGTAGDTVGAANLLLMGG